MAIYQEQVSKRLEDFLDKHLQYEDVGGPESGPELACQYAGPQWAMDLYYTTIEWAEYQMLLDYNNVYGELT